MKLIALACALTLFAVGCDGTTDIDGSGPESTALVTIDSAVMSRCNQMMSFAELSFSFTIENTGEAPLVVGTVAFEGSSANGGETYAAGDIALSAPVTLPVGGSARFSCAPDVALTWSPEGADGAMTLDVALSAVGGGNTGVGHGVDTLRFVEAWDNCDTFAGEPHPCTPIP